MQALKFSNASSPQFQGIAIAVKLMDALFDVASSPSAANQAVLTGDSSNRNIRASTAAFSLKEDQVTGAFEDKVRHYCARAETAANFFTDYNIMIAPSFALALLAIGVQPNLRRDQARMAWTHDAFPGQPLCRAVFRESARLDKSRDY